MLSAVMTPRPNSIWRRVVDHHRSVDTRPALSIRSPTLPGVGLRNRDAPQVGPLPNLTLYDQGGARAAGPAAHLGMRCWGAGPAADKVGLTQPRRKPIRRLDHPSSDIARFLIFSGVIVLAATTVMIAPRASSDELINLRKHLAGSSMQTHD